jgi:hypothetical protein
MFRARLTHCIAVRKSLGRCLPCLGFFSRHGEGTLQLLPPVGVVWLGHGLSLSWAGLGHDAVIIRSTPAFAKQVPLRRHLSDRLQLLRNKFPLSPAPR